MPQQIGLDVRQDRFFGQVEADDRRQISVDGLVVGDASADGIDDAHVAGAIGVQQASHAEMRIGSERERIEEVIVHAAVNDVNTTQAGRRAHVDDGVVDQQVAALDQRNAHLAREERVLEVRGVADAGRQHDDGRVRAIRWGQRAQRGEQRMAVVRGRPDVVPVEQPWEHAFGDGAVREHVGHAARNPEVVFEDDKSAVLEAHEVGARHRDVDVAVDAHAAHLAPVVPAAVDQLARHDALGEDASLVVDVLEKEIDGDEPLREPALERVPFVRGDDAGQQIERGRCAPSPARRRRP